MNTRSTSGIRRLAGLLVVSAVVVGQLDLAQAQSATQILKDGCGDDARKFCSGVQPGGGRIIACLKQNQSSLSDTCKQAAAQFSRTDAAGPLTAAPAATPPLATETGGSPAKPTRDSGASPGGKSNAGDGGSYLVMKKVQITGFGPDAAHASVPAYDLLIPSTWKIQGGVKFGGGPGGCFSDIFAMHLKASSADDSTFFGAGPDDSWQYSDDPSVLKSLNDPYRRTPEVAGKPCRVAPPMKAEEYIRQNILKIYPSGTTVVSVAPFPELNAIVRKRQGLVPGNGSTGATRTEAVRVQLAYQKDGKDIEGWLAVAIVVNIYPAGRGSFYDSHATSLVEFAAPKAKLQANDKLFQVIISSLQPEPQWVAYSGGVLKQLYQAQAQKLAMIDQMRSQFYAHAAQTINGITANAISGANASAFHADQNVRGVQTFRDPTTGKTQELSNLYDHAWQNGSGEYIMSNDPNFNPNEHVSGSWGELQAVNP